MTDPDADADLAAHLALEAGQRLVAIRASWTGEDPQALGRDGDLSSNAYLLEHLAVERPADAVLSEESVDNPARLEADRVWIIDPLDGTREFTMAGRTDWAVHVALWESGRGITAAAVAQPALDVVYSTADGATPPLTAARSTPVFLVSDSRPPAWAQPVASALGARVAPMGSAGAKTMAVIRGEADAYLHAGGQWEWDSAAPVGVALATGLHASRIDGSPLLYNQPHPYLPDLVVCRPDLADAVLAAIARLA
jgi:3'(2'), 5'-bisphosphate nucleotidase